LVIGADGGIRSILARGGQGPTEVGFVASVLVLGQDTILIQDPMNAKMMIFHGETLGRSVRTAADRSLMMVGAVGYEAPSTMLMITRGYSPVAQPTWIRGHLMRFDMDSQAFDSVGSFDLADPPAREGPVHPFRPSGSAVWSGGSFVSGRSDIAELIWRGPDGQVRQVMRWKPEMAYPTADDLQILIERTRASMMRFSEGNPPERIEEILKRQTDRYQLDADRPFPFFGRLLPDGAGGTWMSEYQSAPTPDATSRWSHITNEGDWAGSVTLPERFRLLDIRGDKVLGVLRDEMDVESVAVFTVTSEPRRP
jgi:hypothetical protein